VEKLDINLHDIKFIFVEKLTSIMNRPIQRVAAIHDLSGFGKASLTVVIPILSTMGIQVCPLPTAVLSTHTRFQGFHLIDLTPHLQTIIDHWKELHLHFDAIYSGFLGSHQQIKIVKNFIDDFNTDKTLVVIDPVMGDNGHLYHSIQPEMITGMRSLVSKANVITPNITELSFLLDKDYDPGISENKVKEYIRRMMDLGPETVIVTSVPQPDLPKRTSVIAYSRLDGRYWKVSCDYLPASYPGTGDAFASIITGSLLQGDSLPIALDRAVQFLSYAVRATFGYQYNSIEGLLLERVLQNLHAPVQISSYELLDE
jgi:pyridoxine kinase